MSRARPYYPFTVALALAMSAASALAGERSPAEDFLAVSQAHRSLTRYALEITVNVGEGGQALQAQVQCVDTDQCARTVGGVTVLQTRTWTIAADNSRRTLTVSARDPKHAAAPAYPDPQKVLAEWLKTGAKISGGDVTENGRRWILKSPSPRQSVIELFTDPKTHLLERIVYGADADAAQRVEILYRWNATPVDEARLDPKRYIRVQGKSIDAADDYASYRVIRVQGD